MDGGLIVGGRGGKTHGVKNVAASARPVDFVRRLLSRCIWNVGFGKFRFSRERCGQSKYLRVLRVTLE